MWTKLCGIIPVDSNVTDQRYATSSVYSYSSLDHLLVSYQDTSHPGESIRLPWRVNQVCINFKRAYVWILR